EHGRIPASHSACRSKADACWSAGWAPPENARRFRTLSHQVTRASPLRRVARQLEAMGLKLCPVVPPHAIAGIAENAEGGQTTDQDEPEHDRVLNRCRGLLADQKSSEHFHLSGL